MFLIASILPPSIAKQLATLSSTNTREPIGRANVTFDKAKSRHRSSCAAGGSALDERTPPFAFPNAFAYSTANPRIAAASCSCDDYDDRLYAVYAPVNTST